MWESLISTILSMVGGAFSSSSHDKAQQKLAQLAGQQEVPPSVIQGADVMRETAGQGMPGYEDMLSDIDTQIPTTLNSAKDFVTSGGMVDLLSKLSTKADEQKRQLGYANAEQQLKNKTAYANYLGGTSGQYEYLVNQAKNRLTEMGISEGKQKTADNLSLMSVGGQGLAGLGGSDDWLTQLILNATTSKPIPTTQPNMNEKYGGGAYSENSLDTMWGGLLNFGK